ncbi:transcription antitermination factor NusB [Clostridium sp. SHJSY1]|uniref:transcription antitermination factor NusB n=1 Tax=Clostridium sp. SHJSY1 TaxID=2942483 RepID=UPI002875E8C4|nr:transcription antitermination factor NusB [Clostridium sp. SHJSY1]MDS0527875.1 transcription antitermination factor NusB [Clostridium sp. SHJSY1]
MSRKKSREKAMELSFGMELSKDTTNETLETFVDNFEGDNLKEFDLDYIRELLEGIEKNKGEIDSIIEQNLQNWKIGRLAKINLTILRVAIFEMKFLEDVPGKVAVNEALELTKRYSDEKSVSFVNAVLDKVLKSL